MMTHHKIQILNMHYYARQCLSKTFSQKYKDFEHLKSVTNGITGRYGDLVT